ncbi:putative phosphatase regulatory subunit-domain-containing protein [Biscogniauxia mediterranea]|nr:putative phosphatase regulatory subunit-domain-containing protein [Biscogniauxia mediterranea]
MLIEPYSFLGFHERLIIPPRGNTVVTATTAAIDLNSAYTRTPSPSPSPSISRGPDHLDSDSWFRGWKRKIFPCLPHAKPEVPKSSSVTLVDNNYLITLLPTSLQRQPKSLGMPYTPPSHRSPASSAPPSPEASRRSSFASSGSSSRPALPRSASYLTKHRRSSSASPAIPSAPAPVAANGTKSDMSPPGTSDDLKGAIISPPESSSEDEGAMELEKRAREIENMKELKEAVSILPHRRDSSPTRTSAGDLLVLPSQVNDLPEKSRTSLLTAGLPAINTVNTKGRKISHSRSNTDSHIYLSKSMEACSTSEDGSEQDEPQRKPPMVRKKSGELVRPALRPASHRRPSSMPGTPTFSKAVHFDSHLEHVRHFLQVDRPLAVSAGSSPAENYESDTEYPFKLDETPATRSPPFEWEIAVHNFPTDTPFRKALPARLERVWMSPDQKSLLGSIAVANLAFQKSVVCRFTFDYWKTVSEVTAEFHHEIRPKETECGHDRFQFSIKLSDLANLESKTLYFCIRYNVNNREYWDNNNGINFQVDFRKKMLPQNGKKGFQGASSRPANSLPRSNRRANPSTAPRPKSMPAGTMDEFGHNSKLVGFDQPIHEFLGEARSSGLRLKSSKSTTSIPSDNLSTRLSTPSGVAFANRYDFGASLSAAMQSQRDSNQRSDGLYMKSHKKPAFSTSAATPRSQAAAPPTSAPAPATPVSGPPTATATGPARMDSPSSAAIASSSYEEILNKYCFFNSSKQTSPQAKDGSLRSGRYDGVDDCSPHGSSSNSSSNGSPIISDRHYRGSSAIHHTLRQNLNPYFTNGYHFGNGYVPAIGASPAESPQGPPPATQRTLSPQSSGTPTARSGSPAPMANYLPLAGTLSNGSSSPTPYHAQYVQDRFPFTSDAHAATAIKG